MQNQTTITPGYAHSLWRFLASVKLTVVLLLCLAALSVIGTLIPQNAGARDYIGLYGMFGYRVFELLDIIDMYHSWWFVGLLMMLVVNIIVCSIDRLGSTWKVIFAKTPVFDLQSYRQRKNHIDFEVTATSAHLQERFQRFLKRRFRYCRVEALENGFVITAERGRWTRLGVYGVHLSIIILLLGGLVGSRFGFEGSVTIPEGQSADTIQLERSGQQMTLPFTIRCDDFDVQFYEGGQRPKEFRSSLVVIDGGQEVVRKQIVVNDPLYYKGIGIYQSRYERLQDAPSPDFKADEPPKEVELTLRGAESGIVYTRTATLGTVVQIPEGLGELTLERFEPNAQFQGMDLGPALIATLTMKPAKAQTITLPLKFPRFDSMRKGAVAISVMPKNLAPAQERFATGLQVVHDPGVGLVYAGFLMMIVGCFVAFFMSHQQVVVEVVANGKSAAVMVAGKANKNKPGFELKLQRLSDQLLASAQRGY